MAEVAWFENVLGSFNPTHAASPPATAIDTTCFARHRTIFISDTHLGTRGCKAEALADFLAHNECDTLFLVGDIVDGWQLKRRWYWTEAQSQVVAEILRKVDDGTRVIFVPGNHDEFARDYAGRLFAGVEIINETIHETADGRRLLVLHGDRFDGVIAYAKWLAHVGDWAYGVALRLERPAVQGAQAAGPALLVAVGLAEAQGQERGRIYLPLRGDRWRREAESGAWTGWCAAISIMPKSAGSAASSTSMTETGLKAAAPLSKMPAEIWRFFAGHIPLRDKRQAAADCGYGRRTRQARAYTRVGSRRLEPGPHSRRGGPFEDPDRHRCLDAPGQWRGAHAGSRWARI